MVKVIFVGDKPSKYNVSEDIPFVGAACFSRLCQWIKSIAPDYYVSYNSESSRSLDEIEVLVKDGFKVLALGVHAATRLRDRDIPHLVLPHPSGRNLVINDEVRLATALNEAWLYVRGEKVCVNR